MERMAVDKANREQQYGIVTLQWHQVNGLVGHEIWSRLGGGGEG